MIKTIGSAVAALAVLATASVAPAQPRYDVLPEGQTLAERMVICDTAIFLDSRPNFQANRIYAVRRASSPANELLLPPYFIGPDRWYDEDLEIAATRLRHRGQISRDELTDAFDTYARPLLDQQVGRSRNMTLPRSEIRNRAVSCSRFARDLRLNRVS